MRIDKLITEYSYWKQEQKRKKNGGNRKTYATSDMVQPTKADLSSVESYRNFLHTKRGFGTALDLQNKMQGRG